MSLSSLLKLGGSNPGGGIYPGGGILTESLASVASDVHGIDMAGVHLEEMVVRLLVASQAMM